MIYIWRYLAASSGAKLKNKLVGFLCVPPQMNSHALCNLVNSLEARRSHSPTVLGSLLLMVSLIECPEILCHVHFFPDKKYCYQNVLCRRTGFIIDQYKLSKIETCLFICTCIHAVEWKELQLNFPLS